MNTTLDLKQLAIDRSASPGVRAPRRRHLLARYVVPSVVLVGFATMLGWAARDRLLPAKPVTVLPVVVTRAGVQQRGAALFQAPGWIEPRPTAVLVSALAEGVIKELLVIEGQAVQVGEPVARLIDVDARLALDQAQAELAELRVRQPRLQREAEAARRKEDALSKQRALLIDENRNVADAEAKLQAAEARQRQAQLAGDAARLQLERMVVRSPIQGRVLSLIARPGARLMRLSSAANQDSTSVISLYNPQMLQVRADVRLEDVPRVQSGQPVRIETASARGAIDGEVLSATSRANIQKNTLEVKVAIKNPPATIRPEMLVQVTFLAPEASGDRSAESQQAERLLIPHQLIAQTPEGAFVWLADADGVARRQSIRLGQAGTAELIEVAEGLQVTDKLISAGRANLRDGERIKITGEDPTIGMSARGVRRTNPAGNSSAPTDRGTD